MGDRLGADLDNLLPQGRIVQCRTLFGSVTCRKKLTRLYPRAKGGSRTWVSVKSWQESRVDFTEFFPSLIICSDVPRWL
jgi:hypothetical protein